MKKHVFGIVTACLFACAVQAQKCDSLYQVSLKLFDQKDYQGSLDAVNSVLSVCPIQIDYYLHRAECYEAMKNYKAELTSLNAAIAIDSNSLAAWTKKALIEVDFDLNSSAIKSHQKVLSLIAAEDSTVRIYQINLAALYIKTNQSEKAFNYMSQLCKADSSDVDMLTNLAASAIYTKKYQDAEWALNRVLSIDSNNVGALINMGLCKTEQNKHEEALSFYNRVLQIDPKEPYALNNMGWSMYQMKKYSQALDCINKSIEIDPSNSYAYRNKAYVLIANGASKKNICSTIQLALDKGYTEMYGDDVLRLQQEHCK